MGTQSTGIAERLRKEVATAAKSLILEIDAELRKNPSAGGTPVDTGHARANWVPSIGRPYTGEAQGEGDHASGVAKVLAYKLGPSLYVSNNVPYIARLNHGHSKQAPALFVESAVDRAVATVQARYAGKGIVVG